MNKKKKLSTISIAITGLMAALICVLGPLSIPIGPIPVSLTPFAVFFAVYISGKTRGSIACLIYLLIGLCGVPVFSGFGSGPGKLFGPTGGFLITFFIMAFVGGLFIEKFKNVFMQMLGCFLGLCISYAVGTVWLSVQASISTPSAFSLAVAPFVLFDILKIVAAVFLGKLGKKAIGNRFPELSKRR